MSSAVVLRQVIRNVPGKVSSNPLNAAVKVNGTVYVSGTLGTDPSTGKLAPGGITPECRQLFTNMDGVLKLAGCTKENVVKCVVLLSDYNDFQALNAAYREYFVDPYPARMCYQVSKLPMNARVEIDAVAVEGRMQDVRAKL